VTALILVPASAAAAGQARVIDGDTLEVHGTRIRLWASTLRKAVSFVGARIRY
jgi:endonuclease YncB( thermonuclease family)